MILAKTITTPTVQKQSVQLVSCTTRNNIKLSCTYVFSLYDDEMLWYSCTETMVPVHINQDRSKAHMQFHVRDIKQNEISARLAGMQ